MKEGKPVFYRDNSGHRQRCDRMYETSNREECLVPAKEPANARDSLWACM